MTTQPEQASNRTPAHRDAEHWAKPVDRLKVSAAQLGPEPINVDGRHVVGPLQGFGQMWQKTYRVRLSGANTTPVEVIKTWKADFPKFWPSGNHFYAPLTGIAPGEVGVISVSVGGGMRLSTGVMVIYADDESFTFISPEGHMLSGWITFSAHRDGDLTVAQVQALERTSDPFDELGLMFGGSRMNNRFWEETLRNVAQAMGAAEPVVVTEVVCIDKRRQWRKATNVRNSITLRTMRHTLTAPFRRISGRG